MPKQTSLLMRPAQAEGLSRKGHGRAAPSVAGQVSLLLGLLLHADTSLVNKKYAHDART